MIRAGFVRAGRFGGYCQVIKEARPLFDDGRVALDPWILAANVANKTGYGIIAGRCDFISVLLSALRPTARDRYLWQNAKVATSRIFAEIDLDAVSFGWHSAWTCCGRIYTGNDNPL